MRQAAHDLATLLTVSNGHRQQAEKHLAKARAADEKAMELCRRMLSGKLSAPAGLFDLNAVAAELVGAMEAMGGPLRVELQCARDPIYVAGDALSMHRALLNLCLNARNAEATLITIATSVSDGNAAFISVTDNGSGFGFSGPSELIWQRPVEGAHGHGLAIVKRTIDEHKGTVQVWSEPGETRFNMWFPLAASAIGSGTLAA